MLGVRVFSFLVAQDSVLDLETCLHCLSTAFTLPKSLTM